MEVIFQHIQIFVNKKNIYKYLNRVKGKSDNKKNSRKRRYSLYILV
jgi:hypothetical protein